ncbi:hypothetical protein EDD16DRAFT_1722127 [Pisolithus croceorrhizus]|nr:hypothetical protein EDD16DRAFT_1722127 [Pisolithus croceorrhizus]
MFGGGPVLLEVGLYCGMACVVSQATVGSNTDIMDPVLQRFVTDDFVDGRGTISDALKEADPDQLPHDALEQTSVCSDVSAFLLTSST